MVMVLGDVCCILLKIYDLWKSFFSCNLDHIEAIWVDIVFHSQRLALSVMYRPPKNLFFYESLDKQLRSVAKRSKNSLVMGDLNADLSPRATCNNLGESLQRVLNRNGLVNVIKDYRRITECTKSLIDLSITSIKFKLCDTGIADQRLNYRVLDLFCKHSGKTLMLKVTNTAYRLSLGM